MASAQPSGQDHKSGSLRPASLDPASLSVLAGHGQAAQASAQSLPSRGPGKSEQQAGQLASEGSGRLPVSDEAAAVVLSDSDEEVHIVTGGNTVPPEQKVSDQAAQPPQPLGAEVSNLLEQPAKLHTPEGSTGGSAEGRTQSAVQNEALRSTPDKGAAKAKVQPPAVLEAPEGPAQGICALGFPASAADNAEWSAEWIRDQIQALGNLEAQVVKSVRGVSALEPLPDMPLQELCNQQVSIFQMKFKQLH